MSAASQMVDDYRPAAKPNSSCTSCRRRKLRCDREAEGCSNCAKQEVPCTCPAASTEKAKRKRGPYQKDKTRRERELEHAVKVMESKYNVLSSRLGHAQQGVDITQAESGEGGSRDLTPLASSGGKGPWPVDTHTSGNCSTSSITPSNSNNSFDGNRPAAPLPATLAAPSTTPSLGGRDAPLSNRFWSNFPKDVSIWWQLGWIETVLLNHDTVRGC